MTLEPVSAETVAANRRLLRHLGFGKVPDHVGESPAGPMRATPEVIERALVLHVVLAVAGGLDATAARRWLAALGAAEGLFADEAEYLADAGEGVRVEDAARATGVEGLAVLLWALGLLDEVLPDAPAGSAVAHGLPRPGEPLPSEVIDATLRPESEIVAVYDLAAGMAWALRDDPDLEVGAAPGSLDPYVVRQRLRALRWLLGGDWATA